MQPDLTCRTPAAEKLPLLPSTAVPRIPQGATARKIVKLLRADVNRSWTPGEIVAETGLKKSTVRKELCRLIEPGTKDTPPPVQRTGPGLYAAFLGPGELARIESPEPKIHALQLVWKVPRFGGLPPRSRTRTREAGFGILHADGDWLHDEASRSYRCKRWHDGQRVTLQVFPSTATVLASVNSSKTPLAPADVGRLRSFLEATLQAEGIPWTEPRIVTVEIARDFQRFRLAGREAARFFLGRMGTRGDTLNLGALEGALVQIYNKTQIGAMRQEIRLQPRELDLPNLQALLTSMFYGPLPTDVQPEPLDHGEPGGYV